MFRTSRLLISTSLIFVALVACTLGETPPPASAPGGGTMPIFPPGGGLSPLTPPPSSGQTYYVSPHGNNANPGTQQQPWATPGYASRQLNPGDTLVILGGRYTLSLYNDDILKPPSGTAEAWIIIKGEEGSRPILAGRDNLMTAVDLSGVSYLWLENIEITHDDTAGGEAAWFRDGIEIVGAPASHIIVKDMYIHHLDEFGMNFQDVDDLQIVNCRVEYAGFGALGGPAGEHGGWRDVHVLGSVLAYGGHYYQGGDGRNRPYDRPDGFGIEASQGPIEIVDTVAAHNYGDGLDSKVANTTIRRSIVANNSCDGVKLWGENSRVENTLIYGRGDGSSERTSWAAIVIHTEMADARFEIVNVTVDDMLGGNYLMHVQYDYPQIPVHLSIYNSIFRSAGSNSPIYIGDASRLEVSHSLFYLPDSDFLLTQGETTYTADTILGLGESILYADPLFVNPARGSEGDYHLQPGSPALGAGTPDGAPLDDLTGAPRRIPYDLGAYNGG